MIKKNPDNAQEIFDLEDVYDKKIYPLMSKIIKICQEHKIPMLCSFGYKNDAKKGLEQCTTFLQFEHRKFELMIRAYNKLYCGLLKHWRF